MSDQALTQSGALGGLPMEVRYTTLLAIMFTVPFAAILALSDQLFFKASVYGFMNAQPKEIAYWAAILSMPHIVASLVTFADKEYIQHYRKPLTHGLLISLGLGFGLPFIFGPMGTLFVMAFYTMYHNLMQQYGITLMMLRQPPNNDFIIWKWLTIVPAGLTYLVLLGGDNPVIAEYQDLAVYVLGACLFIAAFFGFRFAQEVMKKPNSKTALTYFIFTGIELYVCFFLIISGYVLLATLVPRIVHDLTAFWIYMVHDQNRNADKVRNPVYALPKKIGIPPVLLCVPISLAISYFLIFSRENLYALSMVVIALNFMHYYMESYMWKRGTPHRQYVPFA